MWTLGKINQYIKEGVEENTHLDYKGSESISKKPERKKEISKDVSALANSDGGVIIYGILEFKEKEKSHLPEKIDAVEGNMFSREWLEQVINSSISPRIRGIVITPIQTETIEDNKVIYVVEIPKGNTAHQAQDKRYYRRYNFESIMMEDWEIKDIINRPQHPNIELEFKLTRQCDKLIVNAYNKGNVYAMFVNIYIELPNICIPQDENEIRSQGKTEFYLDNTKRDVLDVIIHPGLGTGSSNKYGPSWHDPILPKQKVKIGEIELAEYATDLMHVLAWKLYCDNTEPKSGEIRIHDLLQTI